MRRAADRVGKGVRSAPRDALIADSVAKEDQPRAFAFHRQMDHMVEASHASKPRPGVDRVRVPGEAGMRRLREQRATGVALYPTILPALLPWSAKLGVTPPAPLPG